MSAASTLVRRLFWLMAIALAGGAGYRWWRKQQIPTRPDAPEWPPIDVPAPPAEASTAAAQDTSDDTTTTDDAAAADTAVSPSAADTPAGDDVDEITEEPAPASTEEGGGAASVVNALVDAPEARSAAGEGAPWIEPEDDGSCPLSHPIKANDNSGIFHVPGGRFYERTKAERCYVDADSALADGYRQAKS